MRDGQWHEGTPEALASALLLAPYLGWLAFATALSLQIARLNPAGVLTAAGTDSA